MSVDRERVREIFLDALDRAPAELPAFLAARCGADAALRAEVESLLGFHDEAPLIAPRRAHEDALAPTRTSEGAPDDEPVASVSVGDRYRDLDELGVGGFGRVTRSYDRTLRRLVATKEALTERASAGATLLREARLLAYLEHPGVVPVYDVGEGEGGIAYTMKLLAGQTLLGRLRALRAKGQQVPISEALRIITRVCEAMANAHAKGVIHLDLKPANIMLQDFGGVVVIDWGVARFFDTERYATYLAGAGEAPDGASLGAGGVAGTPGYMPPEQFDAASTLGPRADIYAIGAVLYELLAGRRPFASTRSVGLLAARKATTPPPPLRELRPDVSEQLEAICLRMLAPDEARRPADLGAVLSDLAALSDFGDAAPTRRLRAGEVLFREGESGTAAFQILSGVLDISVGSGDAARVIATRGVGEIIGELALLSASTRSATVTARTEAEVRAIDWAAFEAELAKVNPLIGRMLRNLSDKLVEATRR